MTQAVTAGVQARHGIVLLAATGLTAALTFGFMIAAGRTLGPADASDLFAGIFLLFAVHTVFSPVSTAVARTVAAGVATGSASADESSPVTARERAMAAATVGDAGRWTATACLITGVIALMTLPWQVAATNVDGGVLSAAWVAALLLAFINVYRGAMRGTQSFDALAINLVGEATVRVGVGLAVLFATRRADLAMAAYIVGVLATGPQLAMWHRQTWRTSQLETAAATGSTNGLAPAREWARWAIPLLLVAIGDAILQNADVLFVKRALTADEAGSYGAAATVSRALGVLVTPFVLQVVPQVADSAARSLQPGRLVARLAGVYVGISALVLASLWFVGPYLLGAMFGQGFDAAAPVLIPHALGALAGYLAMVLAQALCALGTLMFAPLYLAGALAMIVGLSMVPADMVAFAQVTLVAKVLVMVGTFIAWRVKVGQISALQAS